MAYTLTQTDLQQFTETDHWYRHGFFRRILYTDGIKYMAETGGAYWLLDAIASHITGKILAKRAVTDPRLADMQFWRLEVREDHSAVMTCRADSGVSASCAPDDSLHGLPAARDRHLGLQ